MIQNRQIQGSKLSNSTDIAKFTNAEVGCFGHMGSTHELISASLEHP